MVGEALKGVNFITDTKPRYDAEFYLYLTTAGWCGPCNREMPNVVKQYPLMLKKNVQLIMISADQQPEAATHFMKRNRGDFPCIMGSPTTETQKLPDTVTPTPCPRPFWWMPPATSSPSAPPRASSATGRSLSRKSKMPGSSLNFGAPNGAPNYYTKGIFCQY